MSAAPKAAPLEPRCRSTTATPARRCCAQQIYGLKNGPDNRTNLLVIPTPFVADEAVLTVNLWDPESGRTATEEITGRGAFQINDIFNRVGMGGVETSTAVAHIQYSSTASSAYLRIMASINDNVTSDPTLVNAGPLRGPYTLPVIDGSATRGRSDPPRDVDVPDEKHISADLREMKPTCRVQLDTAPCRCAGAPWRR